MDLSHLKTQLATILMLKGNDDKMSMIYGLLYTFLTISLIEWTMRILPLFSSIIMEYSKKYMKHNYNVNITNNKIQSNEEIHSILLKRTYETKDDINNPNTEMVDSILHYLCNLDNSKNIKLHNQYILDTKDIILVAPNIKAQVRSIKYTDKEELESIEVIIFSNVLCISDLRKWMTSIHDNYKIEKKNNLGNKRFYFNELPVEPMRTIDMNKDSEIESNDKIIYRWDTAPKSLMFTMNEFNTYKSMNNIFGDHIHELKDRLNLFINHPEWYAKRGIPYSLGIMLHGIPGAGKTSTIKAIAKETNRHIINLSLRTYTTQKQMLNLFYNDNITVLTNEGTKQIFNIPLNQRIYVIEDIDCLTDIVLDRRIINNKMQSDKSTEAINLSFLLNLLDGVLETPSRILIITSNYPDKLDKALIRPGRIDVNIKFTYASCKLIHEIMNNFYENTICIEDIPKELDGKLTPAEVIECLCSNYTNSKVAIQKLLKKSDIQNEQINDNTIEVINNSDSQDINVFKNDNTILVDNIIVSKNNDTNDKYKIFEDIRTEYMNKLSFNKSIIEPIYDDDVPNLDDNKLSKEKVAKYDFKKHKIKRVLEDDIIGYNNNNIHFSSLDEAFSVS